MKKCMPSLVSNLHPLFSYRLFFYILSFTIACLSCGSGAYVPEQNTSQDELTSQSTGSVYPHTAGFADPDSHGQYTLANGVQSCGVCHGTDFQGGLSLISCFECHPPYPHRQGWIEPDQHGVSVQEDGIDSCAFTCHGEDFSGKGPATSCVECHDLFPHIEEWASIENHGVFVRDKGTDSCQTACHGTDLSGGLSAVSCTGCHASYPHGQDWETPERHGLYSIRNEKEVCKGCHGDDYLGGLSNIDCRECHDPYPHGTDWVEWDNHGEYVVINGNTTCSGACHGTDFTGGDTNVSCFECHRPYPHNADWTNMSNASNHGRFYVESYVLQDTSNEECASNCHGTDFNGGGTSIACDSCHDDDIFPHVDEGEILWADTGHQNKINFLGSDTLCKECHSDYKKGAYGGPLITCTSYCHQ